MNHPAGTISIGTTLEFFRANEFLSPSRTDSTAALDHSRLVNSFTLVYTPLRYLEAAFGIRVISDNSTGPNADELQVTVGDPQLALKGGYEVFPGITVGGALDARLLTAAGFFEAGSSAISFGLTALASWFGGSKLPIGVHVNLGFAYDGSDSLFDAPEQLSAPQLFAAQVSSFHRIVSRIGVEYVTKYVGPFVELELEPFIGSGAPGFGDSPGRLSFGARGWLGERKGLQLMAALDVGLTGVGDGSAADLGGKFAYVIPRWNLVMRASYRFDPFYSPAPTIVKEAVNTPVAPPQAFISGKVIDSQSLKPVWNARVKIADSEASALAVNAKDGSFRSFAIPLGTRAVVASAEGYMDTRVLLDVSEDGAKTVIQMTPKVRFKPGTIRGTVTKRGGRALRTATVLIPALDRTIALGKDGKFSVSLKPGQYKVVVSAPGMRTQERTIRVIEGDTVILNVELYK
jgi:hypothetical protein